MRPLATWLDQQFARPDMGARDPSLASFVAAKEVGLAGIILGDEVLFLHDRGRYSFRVRLCNMGDMDGLRFVHTPPLWEREYLGEYFRENRDNVYAVYNVANTVGEKLRGAPWPVRPLTQLPPLSLPKAAEVQAQGVDRIVELARPGDVVFTYDRQSGIHRLIRRHDWGHWGHCGVVDSAGVLFEATLSGVARSPLKSLKRPSLDVGLYRLRDHEFTPECLTRMQRWIDQTVAGERGYDWAGVLRIVVLRHLGLWHRTGSLFTGGLSALINANALDLIAYA